MNKIRTTIGVTALVVSSAACTPKQVADWVSKMAEAAATPDPADDIALTEEINAIPPEPDTPCSEWYWHALEAGFTHEEWMFPLSGILWDESRCDPNAYNQSGATGLAQVMPMWVRPCGGGDLRDPMFNLRCSRHVVDDSGWDNWSTWKG